MLGKLGVLLSEEALQRFVRKRDSRTIARASLKL